LAFKYGKTPAQVILRWHIQHGFCAITNEAECEVTDDWMWKRLVPAVQFDVVRGPRDAELLAAGRELTDEVGEALVVGVPAHLGVGDPGDVVIS
jgi:hypothetical protein